MDNKNNFLVIGLVVVLVIGVGAFFLFGQNKEEEPSPTESPLENVLSDLDSNSGQEEQKMEYTLEEVAVHDNKDDCWLAIEGGVYDATPFIAAGQHPGKDAILEGCGIDATELFNTRPMGSGTPHSDQARTLLADFYIGDLVEKSEDGGGVMDNKGTEDVTELKIEDTVVGKGEEAVAGKSVTVNYKGTLTDGTVFDSSYDKEEPFSFELGAGRVIEGWDEGVVGMKVGGKRVLIIPADMAYGSQAVGAIPPNSTLIFEVELLEVE